MNLPLLLMIAALYMLYKKLSDAEQTKREEELTALWRSETGQDYSPMNIDIWLSGEDEGGSILVGSVKDPIDLVFRRLEKYHTIIVESATFFDLDPRLIKALIWKESTGDPKAKSKAGALGLMQVMYSTAKDTLDFTGSRADLLKPEVNIPLGTAYLHLMKTTSKATNEATRIHDALYHYCGGSNRYAGEVLTIRNNLAKYEEEQEYHQE